MTAGPRSFARFKRVRSEVCRKLKEDFFRAASQCPCCKADGDFLNVTFWFRGVFSVKCPRWVVVCKKCLFRAEFSSDSGERAAKSLHKEFLRTVALRLMGKKRRRKRKPSAILDSLAGLEAD